MRIPGSYYLLSSHHYNGSYDSRCTIGGWFTKVLGEVTLEEVVLSEKGGGDYPNSV